MAGDAEGSEVPWEQRIIANVCTTCVLLVSLAFFSENILLISVAIHASLTKAKREACNGKNGKNNSFRSCFGTDFVVCVQ